MALLPPGFALKATIIALRASRLHCWPQVHEQRSRVNIYAKLSPLLVTKVTKQLNRPLFDSHFVSRALSKLPPIEGEKFVSVPKRPLNEILLANPQEEVAISCISIPLCPTGVQALITVSTMSVYAPGDRPATRRLYIITEGVGVYRSRILGIGDSWGEEDVLLTYPPQPTRETKAVT